MICKRFVICTLICVGLSFPVFSQTIGKVVDTNKHPVEGATIVMQLPDSTYLGVAISAADGTFMLEPEPENYQLIVQHLLYQTRQVKSQARDVGIIILEAQDYNLEEVVIKGEKPLVKVENGRLGYKLSVLSEKQVVNNAYEAIAKLPGVQESSGILSLAGASSLTIVMNGKPTTMTAEQLEILLRNTPLDRVEKAEVMYSAPSELHVRGAVINVVMKRSNDYSFQGDLNTYYQNRYFNSGGANGNFRFSTPKFTLDVMYGADNVKTIEYTELFSRHTQSSTSLDVMTEDVLRSSEIEGVILNSDRVRSSIARHLGIETVGLRLTRTITDMLLAKADGFPLRFYSMSQKFFVKRNHIFVSEGLLLIHILWAISADLQVPMREYAVVALYADASLLQLLLQYFQLSIKLPAFPISCFNVWNTVHNISR